MQEYVLDKKIWLCTGLNLTVNDIRDEIATGFLSKDAAHLLISCEFDITDAILQEVSRFERLDISRRQRIGEKRAVSRKSSFLPRTTTNETTASGKKKEALKDDMKVIEPDRINLIKVDSEVGILELPITIYAKEKSKVKAGQKIGDDILTIEEAHRRPKSDKPISDMGIITDAQGTCFQRQQLINLFKEYLDCIALDISELG